MDELGEKHTKSQLQEMINSVDTDNSGTVYFLEFLTMMLREVSKEEQSPLLLLSCSLPSSLSHVSLSPRFPPLSLVLLRTPLLNAGPTLRHTM